MISVASVLRDLHAGRTVRRCWAREACDLLERDGQIVVVRGIARLPGRVEQRRQTAERRRVDERRAERRASGLYQRARAREAQIAALLPATTPVVAEALGLTLTAARAALRRAGAVSTMVRVATLAGVSRWRVALWTRAEALAQVAK